MKTREEVTPSRGKLMLTGTLAMFAMGAIASDAFATAEKKEATPEKPKSLDAESAADKDQARPSQVVYHFAVPAGSLEDVAAAMSQVLGVKVVIAVPKYNTVPSPGVTGVMTAEEAFAAALKGTHISADFVSADRVMLDLHDANQSVTVTAQQELSSLKYTAPLNDLPQTLTIIPEAILESTASNSLVEALRTVPGITFGAGEGGTPTGDRPFIRGFDAQSSTFVDGMRDIGAQSREVFDVDSIEVSKGPSSSFVGRSAEGGSLNLNSKLARRDNFVTGSYMPGSANYFRGVVDGNMKVTKWLAARVAAMGQDEGIAGRDIVQDQRYGVAPSLLFNVSHRGRVVLNYYDVNAASIPDPGIPYNNPTNYYTGTIARPDGRAQIFQPGDGEPLLINRNFFYGLRSRDFRNEKVRTAYGRADYNVTEGTVLRNSYRYGTSRQDYLYSQPDDSQGNILYGLLYRRALSRNTYVDTSINQTDFSGSFKTGPMHHTFATGGEFSRERSWNSTYSLGSVGGTTTTPAIPNFFLLNPATKTRMNYSASRCPVGAGAASGYYCEDFLHPTVDDPFYGVNTVIPTQVGSTQAFSNVTYSNALVKNNNPTRQIVGTMSAYGFDTVTAGKLQLTGGVRYDHYNANYRNVLTCVATAAVPCTFLNITGLVNFQGAVAYKPKKSTTLYGSVSKSSTPPGNSLSQGSDPSALTSTVNQNLPPETTRSEEAGVKQELFGTKALLTGAFFWANTDNVRITQADGSIASVGSRRNRGVDVGITGYVSRRWQVFGGYTYMNAILTNAGSTTVNGVVVSGYLNGTRFPNTPENSFSVTSYYQVTRKLSLGGGIYGTGKVYGNANPSSLKWVPSYVREDLYGSYRFSPHLELTGNVLNLSNKTYYLQAYATHYATLAPGRQARMAFNFRF